MIDHSHAGARQVERPAGHGARWGWLLLAGCLVAGPLRAQISLSAVVDLAQRNSSAVKLADADLSKATAALAEAHDVYIPSLVLGSSVGPPSIGFTFSQPSIASGTVQSLAFSFPQKQYIRAAESGMQAAQLSLREARDQVTLEASADYIELDTIESELKASDEQRGFADRLLKIEQERQQAGVDPVNEVLQGMLKVAQLKLSRIHLESRAATLVGQIVSLTGLPAASIQTEHASIPEIPAVHADEVAGKTAGIRAAQAMAASRQLQAKGDFLSTKLWPTIGFGAQYNRDATSLNNYNTYFGSQVGSERKKFKADNFTAGFNIQIPLFDIGRRDKSRESAAEALRATVEAEQAQRQNDVQIATLAGNLRELDALAEVASLKQQIASEQLKTVEAELQTGNGSGGEPGATPQLSPKMEQLAHIDERQKAIDAIDSGFDLSRARLNLLRALGHMDDWLHELSSAQPDIKKDAQSGAQSPVQPKEPASPVN